MTTRNATFEDRNRCEVPPRCCYRGAEDAPRCPSAATVTVIDGDPSAPTYACDEHRGCFAGTAWPVGSG